MHHCVHPYVHRKYLHICTSVSSFPCRCYQAQGEINKINWMERSGSMVCTICFLGLQFQDCIWPQDRMFAHFSCSVDVTRIVTTLPSYERAVTVLPRSVVKLKTFFHSELASLFFWPLLLHSPLPPNAEIVTLECKLVLNLPSPPFPSPLSFLLPPSPSLAHTRTNFSSLITQKYIFLMHTYRAYYKLSRGQTSPSNWQISAKENLYHWKVCVPPMSPYRSTPQISNGCMFYMTYTLK